MNNLHFKFYESWDLDAEMTTFSYFLTQFFYQIETLRKWGMTVDKNGRPIEYTLFETAGNQGKITEILIDAGKIALEKIPDAEQRKIQSKELEKFENRFDKNDSYKQILFI